MDSIVGQVGVEVHIVVGDDASSDDTLKRLEKYGAGRLRIEARSVASGSAAQNFFSLIRGNDAEEFDFVAFSDQDDLWNLDRLAQSAAWLQTTGSVGYSSATTAFWTNGRARVLRQHPRTTKSDFLFEGAGQGCSFVLTRKFYTEVRRLITAQRKITDQLRYHDWTVYALARAWGYRWSFDPRSTLRYRQHERNDTGARLSLDGARRRFRKLSNGWYRSQLDAIGMMASMANPADPTISEWALLRSARAGLVRRFRMARFCRAGGRRKLSDRWVLIGSALLGWI